MSFEEIEANNNQFICGPSLTLVQIYSGTNAVRLSSICIHVSYAHTMHNALSTDGRNFTECADSHNSFTRRTRRLALSSQYMCVRGDTDTRGQRHHDHVICTVESYIAYLSVAA